MTETELTAYGRMMSEALPRRSDYPGKPHFVHDCNSCTFLGHFFGRDVYRCGDNFVSRFGSDGPDYQSYDVSALLNRLRDNAPIGSVGPVRREDVAYRDHARQADKLMSIVMALALEGRVEATQSFIAHGFCTGPLTAAKQAQLDPGYQPMDGEPSSVIEQEEAADEEREHEMEEEEAEAACVEARRAVLEDGLFKPGDTVTHCGGTHHEVASVDSGGGLVFEDAPDMRFGLCPCRYTLISRGQ